MKSVLLGLVFSTLSAGSGATVTLECEERFTTDVNKQSYQVNVDTIAFLERAYRQGQKTTELFDASNYFDGTDEEWNKIVESFEEAMDANYSGELSLPKINEKDEQETLELYGDKFEQFNYDENSRSKELLLIQSSADNKEEKTWISGISRLCDTPDMECVNEVRDISIFNMDIEITITQEGSENRKKQLRCNTSEIIYDTLPKVIQDYMYLTNGAYTLVNF